MNSKIAIRQLKFLDKITPKIRLAAEWEEKWKVLISTILSAQTKDETTIKISEILFKKYNSLEKLAKTNLKEIKKIIRPINYYKTKSKHIKETAKIIVKKYNSIIPDNLEALLELPGVGRKVGNVYLAEACNMNCIGVDTHVSRISQKLIWTKQKDKHKIEKDLEELFPKSHWRSINYILVRFGRTHSRKQEDEILKTIK
jgi:endonuclease-3